MRKFLDRLISKITYRLARRGPFRFALRGWPKPDDLELSARVLTTEFFRKSLRPVPLPLNEFARFVVLAPHQDDETLGAGGTMALAAKLGAKITVIYTTDGEQRHASRGISVSSETRMKEAQQACNLVGADIRKLPISNLQTIPTVDDLRALLSLLRELKPQVVMLPWFLDTPPRHRLANHMLWLAMANQIGLEFEIWGYQVHNTLFPNGIVEITQVADTKQKMLKCFISQNDQFHRYDHIGMSLSGWNSRHLTSGDHHRERYAEIFLCLPHQEYLKMVSEHYTDCWEQVYQNDSTALPGALAMHRAAMEVIAREGRL